MKALFLASAIAICFTFDASAQSTPSHTWTLTNGKTCDGYYFSSGLTTVVIKSYGTNCLFAIADLCTNDLIYFYDRKMAVRQRQLDIEALAFKQSGRPEMTESILENFPEKSEDHPGWMDVEFEALSNVYVDLREDELGMSIRDKNGEWWDKCLAFKTDRDGNPDPVIPKIMALKKGDKIRLLGVAMDDNDETKFFVTDVEMIQTAQEIDTVNKLKGNL
jgi:hypothetical protein